MFCLLKMLIFKLFFYFQKLNSYTVHLSASLNERSVIWYHTKRFIVKFFGPKKRYESNTFNLFTKPMVLLYKNI